MANTIIGGIPGGNPGGNPPQISPTMPYRYAHGLGGMTQKQAAAYLQQFFPGYETASLIKWHLSGLPKDAIAAMNTPPIGQPAIGQPIGQPVGNNVPRYFEPLAPPRSPAITGNPAYVQQQAAQTFGIPDLTRNRPYFNPYRVY